MVNAIDRHIDFAIILNRRLMWFLFVRRSIHFVLYCALFYLRSFKFDSSMDTLSTNASYVLGLACPLCKARIRGCTHKSWHLPQAGELRANNLAETLLPTSAADTSLTQETSQRREYRGESLWSKETTVHVMGTLSSRCPHRHRLKPSCGGRGRLHACAWSSS